MSSRGSAFVADLFGIPYAPLGPIDMQKYRPASLNQPYKFKQALSTGRVMLGTGLSIASLPVARIQAVLNFDFIFVDAEHTPMGPDTLQDIIKTCNYHSEGQTATIVRVPTHGHEWAAWTLDAGASGIIFPHTETVEQAKTAIKNCRFSPIGDRSYPPFATIPGHTDGAPEGQTMMNIYNDHAAIFMQIESVKGVENVEEIAALPGVDGIMIGTADLRMSMGLMPGVAGPEPEFNEAMAKIEAACAKNNKPILGFALGPLVNERMARGWKLLMMSADALAMVAGQTGPLKETRAAVAEFEKGKTFNETNGVTNGLPN
ncbi:Phosphoenolpyruvate/pyruvate domain-containing protein [Pseudohyphozyma bogoriensis]|nr:Phosphoenolpyruvate/pyruvate domain-containing protein [Pseudohyphozyma bogoriensis]